MAQIRVMHMVDTLTAGGRERVVVNLVNSLPRDRYLPYLCTTRYDGSLANRVANDVRRLSLNRTFRYDVRGIYHLVHFIQANRIQILHAHDASLFLARIAALLPPYSAIVWHDHFGLYAVEERPVWLYKPAVTRARAVIAVNKPLAEWSCSRLHVPRDRVRYIPNFVCPAEWNGQHPALPGKAGQRIVCVANLRAQKDQLTLLHAMEFVVRQIPDAHLLLVGAPIEEDYANLLRSEIVRRRLARNVAVLGERDDVFAILQACDIGILSSVSEGLPLALLEYGLAGLPVIATNVGQCGDVLDYGRAGILVPPASPDQLAEALLSLLQFPECRRNLAKQLHHRVQKHHSPDAVIEQVCNVYDTVLRT